MDVTTLQQQLFITDLMHKNEKNHNENLIENEPSFYEYFDIQIHVYN